MKGKLLTDNPAQSNEIETKVAFKIEAHTIFTAFPPPNSDNKNNNQQNPVNNIKRNELEKSDIIVIEDVYHNIHRIYELRTRLESSTKEKQSERAKIVICNSYRHLSKSKLNGNPTKAYTRTFR